VRWAADGKPAEMIATFEGRRLNSPNDVAPGTDGAMWFTDPTFGIAGFGPEKADPEQPVRGIYRVKDGQVSLMNGDLAQPNGLAFAPNGTSLYVADTKTGAVVRFPVEADGSLGKRARFASVEAADGLRVDSKGRVWVAGKGGLHVFEANGKKTCIIPIEAGHVANLAFGGPDGDRVLVTATESVWILRID
jgi:gluconolactonase